MLVCKSSKRSPVKRGRVSIAKKRAKKKAARKLAPSFMRKAGFEISVNNELFSKVDFFLFNNLFMSDDYVHENILKTKATRRSLFKHIRNYIKNYRLFVRKLIDYNLSIYYTHKEGDNCYNNCDICCEKEIVIERLHDIRYSIYYDDRAMRAALYLGKYKLAKIFAHINWLILYNFKA
jgi:hypothetical protein